MVLAAAGGGAADACSAYAGWSRPARGRGRAAAAGPARSRPAAGAEPRHRPVRPGRPRRGRAAHRQAQQALSVARRRGRASSSTRTSPPDPCCRCSPTTPCAPSPTGCCAPCASTTRTGRGDLVASLRAWLSRHGQWDAAAADLGVHRHTLRYRMRRVEEILGRSLDDPDVRMELWLALKATCRRPGCARRLAAVPRQLRRAAGAPAPAPRPARTVRRPDPVQTEERAESPRRTYARGRARTACRRPTRLRCDATPSASPTAPSPPLRKGRDPLCRHTSPHAFWLAGRKATGDAHFDVTSPWDGRLVGTVSIPTEDQVEEAIAAAVGVRGRVRRDPRARAGRRSGPRLRRLVERSEEIARLISAENGKPMKWARGEVGRAVSVFRFAADEARRFNGGEAQRLDTDAGGVGRLALTRRYPRGVVLGIAPFNFPSTCAPTRSPRRSRSAPRSSSSPRRRPRSPGCSSASCWPRPPCPRAPGRSCRCPTTGCPPWSRTSGCRSSPSPARRGRLRDPRLGAAQALHAGARRQRRGGRPPATAPPRRTSTGRRSASPPSPTTRAASPASRCSGSIADATVYDRLVPKIVAAVEAQVTGDPSDDATDVGPLVSEDAAKRVEAWVDEAVQGGAKLLAAASGTAPPTRRPCSPTCPPDARSPARRSSARS